MGPTGLHLCQATHQVSQRTKEAANNIGFKNKVGRKMVLFGMKNLMH